MKDIVVHSVTAKTLASLQANLPQSLLLSGERGVGLRTIATWLAGAQLAGEVRPQNNKDQTDDENGTITVEMIRRLYDQTRAKHTSRQIIIIDDADRMSNGAQSAFLKLLEEPNSQIYFILTSHHAAGLLPTIRSRVQHSVVQPVTKSQSTALMSALGEQEAVKQAQLLFIAEGLPAELTRLIQDEGYFKDRAGIIGDARDFLKASSYEKLLLVQKYRSDRTQVIGLIDNALHILRRSVSAQPQPGLITQMKRLLEAREQIDANHNISLTLARIVL